MCSKQLPVLKKFTDIRNLLSTMFFLIKHYSIGVFSLKKYVPAPLLSPYS